MSDPVEIELKLEYDPADRERLIASPLLASADRSRHQLTAIYFDTPDRRLDKAGYALRIRSNGESRVQTVKASSEGSAGLFIRGEWERPVPDDIPVLDDRSGPLRQLVDAATLDRLVPLFTSQVERVSGEVEHSSGLIEYAIDAGEIRAGARATPLSEIELELREGSPHILFGLARNLNETVPLRLGVQTKSARGQALAPDKAARAIRAEPIRLDPAMCAGDAFAMIAASCIRQYRLNEALLLDSGGAEAIHQARVALRRLRTAFWLFRSLIADDKRAKALAAEIRWLAGELGTIRDIDVLLPRLDKRGRATLSAIRDRNFAHVRNQLAGSRARLLPIELVEWLAVGVWRNEPVDDAARDRNIQSFADERLDRLRKRIKRNGRALATTDDAHRHDVRKDAKKLRYASEFFVSLYPGRKARRRLDSFLGRLEQLQDGLGHLNDLAAAPELLIRLGIEAPTPALGRKAQRRLLDEAQDSLDALIDSKRFWRS